MKSNRWLNWPRMWNFCILGRSGTAKALNFKGTEKRVLLFIGNFNINRRENKRFIDLSYHFRELRHPFIDYSQYHGMDVKQGGKESKRGD
jgi:hypothetical protein